MPPFCPPPGPKSGLGDGVGSSGHSGRGGLPGDGPLSVGPTHSYEIKQRQQQRYDNLSLLVYDHEGALDIE